MKKFGERAKKFLRRPASDRRLLLEAAAYLLAARVALWALPFRVLARGFGAVGCETTSDPLDERRQRLVRRVEWAVQAVVRHAPPGFVCLPQAIAARRMLRRRRIATTLYLGVRPEENAGLAAHAWLRAGDRILTGRQESRRHKALAAFGDAAAFPPELEAVLALLRSALGRGTPAMRIENPGAFLRCAARHRVGGVLRCRLPEAVRAALPETVRAGLDRQARNNVRRALGQTAELLKIATRFRRNGILWASVKGPLLSQDLYGDLAARHAGDLDLLIGECDLDRAEAILGEEGFHRTRPHITLTSQQRRHYAEKEFEFQKPGRNLRVELRWLLDGIGTLADVAPRRRTFRGEEFSVLPDSLNVAYLCLHGATHGWRRLFWLVDMALLMKRPEIDWNEVMREAKARGIERAVLEAAALAEELLGVRRPNVLHLPENETTIARLSRNAKRQIALPETQAGTLRNFLREVTHRIRIHRSLPGKWQCVRPHFHSARNWEDLPLPDRWFRLYMLLGPILWVRRRMKPRRQGFGAS